MLGDQMKSRLLFLSLMLISLSSLASTNDLECVGELIKETSSRRSHLVFNEETKQLEGYRGSIQTGGIIFQAKQIKDTLSLQMLRNENLKDVVIAKAKLPMNSDMKLTISLEDGFEASLFCFKK
jgi:hypothetical protein